MITKKSDLIIVIGVTVIWLYITVNLSTILGLIYVAMIYFYWNKKQSGQVYPVIKGRENLARIFGIGVIIAFIWVYLISSMVGSIAPGVDAEKFQKMFAIIDRPMHPYMTLFIVGLLIPITEELFFRGAIIPFLKNKVKLTGILLIITASALFGTWHLMAYQAENQAMLSAFVFALLVSYLTIKRGHLAESIAIHVVLNSVIMLGSLGYLTIAGI